MRAYEIPTLRDRANQPLIIPGLPYFFARLLKFDQFARIYTLHGFVGQAVSQFG